MKKPWHPIATAPRDGSLIIAKNPDDRGDHYPYRARWIDRQWVRLSWGGAVGPVRTQPTLWREPPKMSEAPARSHSAGQTL
jgi:hypothetical protein